MLISDIIMVSLIDILSSLINYFCQLAFRSLIWTNNYHWDFDCSLLVCVTGVADILRQCRRTVLVQAVMKVPILRLVCLNVCSRYIYSGGFVDQYAKESLFYKWYRTWSLVNQNIWDFFLKMSQICNKSAIGKYVVNFKKLCKVSLFESLTFNDFIHSSITVIQQVHVCFVVDQDSPGW